MVEVRWTSQSLEDIDNIAQYIAKDSERYAEILVADFFQAASVLERFPKAGRIVPEADDPILREIIVGFYRIIYKIRPDQNIDILTVYHTKRILTRRKIKKLR